MKRTDTAQGLRYGDLKPRFRGQDHISIQFEPRRSHSSLETNAGRSRSISPFVIAFKWKMDLISPRLAHLGCLSAFTFRAIAQRQDEPQRKRKEQIGST